MKQCAKCFETRPLTEFGLNAYYQNVGAKDGLSIYCKGCCRSHMTGLRARKRAMKEAIKRALGLKELLEGLMVCSDCSEWFSVKSRTPKVCRDCESKAIARAAKEPDTKALTIAEVASWIQTNRAPHVYRRAWVIA